MRLARGPFLELPGSYTFCSEKLSSVRCDKIEILIVLKFKQYNANIDVKYI